MASRLGEQKNEYIPFSVLPAVGLAAAMQRPRGNGHCYIELESQASSLYS